jgi:hypothetical protein
MVNIFNLRITIIKLQFFCFKMVSHVMQQRCMHFTNVMTDYSVVSLILTLSKDLQIVRTLDEYVTR